MRATSSARAQSKITHLQKTPTNTDAHPKTILDRPSGLRELSSTSLNCSKHPFHDFQPCLPTPSLCLISSAPRDSLCFSPIDSHPYRHPRGQRLGREPPAERVLNGQATSPKTVPISVVPLRHFLLLLSSVPRFLPCEEHSLSREKESPKAERKQEVYRPQSTFLDEESSRALGNSRFGAHRSTRPLDVRGGDWCDWFGEFVPF